MRRWIDVLRWRLRALFRRDQVDRELDRELRFHLDSHVEELVQAGHPPDEARRIALREFGSTASIAEQCRDARRVNAITHLAQDLRYAVRGLAARPMLFAAATISIALGTGANLTVFALANHVLLSMPTAFRPDRLVHIRTVSGSHVSYGTWREFHESGALAGIAGHQIEFEVNWRGPEAAVAITPLVVTANFFDVVRPPFAQGRGFTAAEADADREPRVVVVSSGFWKRRLGGDPSIVGSSINLNGEPYLVTGVLPEKFTSPPGYGLAPEVFLPISRTLMPDLDNPRAAAVQLVGRLRDGQTAEEARAVLGTVALRIGKREGSEWLRRITLVAPAGSVDQVEFREAGAFFAMLLAVSLLVLAIACANVAGLLLARSTAREREIAVRPALGASRSRVVQQLLADGFVLAIAGTLAALAVTKALDLLVARLALPIPMPMELHLAFDGRLIWLAAGLALVSTMMAGLAPALQASRSSVLPALKQEATRYIHRRLTLRSLLVGAQVAVSVLLLATTMLFVKNLALAQSLDPGFDTDTTAVVRISYVEGRQARAGSAIESVVDQVRSLPGVESAAFARGVPLTLESGGLTQTDMRMEGRAAPVRVRYAVNSVGPGYFHTLGIRMEQGRDFTPQDRGGAPVVIVVNREFVRRYMDGDPVGRRVYLPGAPEETPATVIGVVSDAKYRTLGEDRAPAIYLAYAQGQHRQRRVQMVVRASQQPEAIAGAVRDAILRIEPSAAVGVEPMASALAFAFLPSRIGAALVGTMGALGTLLAMVGLYGTVSFAVSRRTPEIGIRMALGATPGVVMRLVLSDGGLLVAGGIGLGLGLAVIATQPLSAFLMSGLSTSDAASYSATALLLAVTSLAAAWSPARRAARIQPAVSLRSE